jgi:hypothetical protein
MLGDTALGAVNMADEEGGDMGLLLVQLLLGKETDHRRFQCVSVPMPCYYSDHSALVAVIYAEGGGTKAVQATDPAVPHLPPPHPTDTAEQ